MANAEIKEAIRSVIKPNDVKGITAEDLANVLELMVDGCEPSGGGDSNTFYLYGPIFTSGNVSNFAALRQIVDSDKVEVPIDIKEFWYEVVDAWIAHNQETYAKMLECYQKGEDFSVVLISQIWLQFVIVLYIGLIEEAGVDYVDPYEILINLEELLYAKEYYYPEIYDMSTYDGLRIHIYHSAVLLDSTGEWALVGTYGGIEVTFYCEGVDRPLTQEDCDTNKKALEADFPDVTINVSEYREDGISDTSRIIPLERISDEEVDFPTVNGGIVNTTVTKLRYMRNLEMYEVQISNEDGYARNVKLGTIQLV